ncbi:membrane protein, putative [Anaeromyxobacter dehalogenans 2CP-C]|uniref:Membrane protein, putative n=1 Tax=Anaeromyxobacter dehalogenans (strain 2CP-C) TaxID=290397 RepID=Q2IK32_ANADE|nr:membrane protein, putative [Anaeromyxobacter dehalogenans 2CP-C]
MVPRPPPAFLLPLAVAAALLAPAGAPAGEESGAPACAPDASAEPCPPVSAAPPAAAPTPAAGPALVVYWGVGCPHCEEALPYLDALARAHPALVVARYEVRQDAAGRARFRAEVERLGISPPGIPLFVAGDRHVLGFARGRSEAEVEALALGALARGAEPAAAVVDLPLLGPREARRIPLAALTAVVGLLDGLNPCAMWVLVVLLGLLANVRSRRRALAFGGAFVLVSGVVYFAFMTAWSGLFAALGGSRSVTVVLGVALVAMGLVNVKELFLFRRGPTLTIPDRAKPALYRRMRRIAGATRLPAALLGVVALALLANLVELGCTVGLPALYTRILSLRPELAPWQRLGWIAAYNAFYVIPLGAIVAGWAAFAPRARLGERGARALKAASGILLVAFGVALLAAPGLLI